MTVVMMVIILHNSLEDWTFQPEGRRSEPNGADMPPLHPERDGRWRQDAPPVHLGGFHPVHADL